MATWRIVQIGATLSLYDVDSIFAPMRALCTEFTALCVFASTTIPPPTLSPRFLPPPPPSSDKGYCAADSTARQGSTHMSPLIQNIFGYKWKQWGCSKAALFIVFVVQKLQPFERSWQAVPNKGESKSGIMSISMEEIMIWHPYKTASLMKLAALLPSQQAEATKN